MKRRGKRVRLNCVMIVRFGRSDIMKLRNGLLLEG